MRLPFINIVIVPFCPIVADKSNKSTPATYRVNHYYAIMGCCADNFKSNLGLCSAEASQCYGGKGACLPLTCSSYKAWTLNTGERKAVFGKLTDMERHLFANGAQACECIIRR